MGLFDNGSYWGFLVGVVVLAGFILNPLVYIYYRSISYLQALIPSLLVSAVIVASVRRDGTFSWIRCIVVCAAIFLFAYEYSRRTGQTLQMGGGFLMFLSTIACGYVCSELWDMIWPKKE